MLTACRNLALLLDLAGKSEYEMIPNCSSPSVCLFLFLLFPQTLAYLLVSLSLGLSSDPWNRSDLCCTARICSSDGHSSFELTEIYASSRSSTTLLSILIESHSFPSLPSPSPTSSSVSLTLRLTSSVRLSLDGAFLSVVIKRVQTLTIISGLIPLVPD